MAKLIGVTGLARAGKDTFAAQCAARGYDRGAFADALKEATAFIADEPQDLYFNDTTKEEYSEALGMTRRKALQGLGNGVREVLGPMTWVNRLLRRWEADGRPPMVISDVRYPNEAEAVRALGGAVVRIVRDGAGLSGEAGKHISEAGVPDDFVDFEVLNNGTIDDLGRAAARVIQFLETGK